MQRLCEYTFLHACRLFYVLHFGLWRRNTFRESWKRKKLHLVGLSVCVLSCVCVWKKDDEDLYPWLCLHENLPTLFLLCKLKQKQKEKRITVSLTWVSFSPVSMNEYWTSHLQRNVTKPWLILHCAEIKLVNSCFPIGRGRDKSVSLVLGSVYSVYCIRMWTHNYFLQMFGMVMQCFCWMCACLLQPEQAFHYR